jgi:hypothetical protein
MESNNTANPPATSTEPTPKPLVKVTEDGKHLLQSGWTFWFDKKSKDKTKSYEDNLVQLATFNTLEDFWRFLSFTLKFLNI